MAVRVREARKEDGPALGRMGASLARMHHQVDPLRFMLPPNVEAGYRWWLLRELKDRQAVLLVAEVDGAVVGYGYGRVEERDWNALRDRCGALHDLWVEKAARRMGLGEQLAEAVMRRLVAKGCPRVVLMTAARNGSARRLFARLGWRPTMFEMTREAKPSRRRAR